jgi:hypothetical protein
MTPLSPQAQAVLDSMDEWASYDIPTGLIAAAALRAVVAECPYTDDHGSPYINGDELLAIAAELEQ